MSFIPGANVGPYRIVEQAERNGLATTYTAYQPAQGRYVSVITMPNIAQDDVSLLRQRQRQLELISSLRHPNILTLLDHGEHQGVSFIVTELIEAEPLTGRLGAPWPLAEVVRVLRPVAAALDYAHEQGIVHGDVRPGMILLTPDGTPILGGFGLNQHLAVPPDEQPTLVPGQRSRSATEEVAAGQQRDRRGLALIAYEMLTGRSVEVEGVSAERALPPAQLGSPLLAPPVERTLLRELAGEPSERYPSASAFVADLASVPASGVPLREAVVAPAAAATASGPAADASRRRLTIVAAVLATVLLLGLAVIFTREFTNSRSAASTRATDTAATTTTAAGPATAGPGATVAAKPGAAGTTGATGAAGAAGAAAAASGAATAPAASAAGAAASAATAEATQSAQAAAAPAATSAGTPVGGAIPAPLPTRSGTPVVLVPTPAVSTATLESSAVAAAPANNPAAVAAAPTARASTGRIPANWRVSGDGSGRWSIDDQGRTVGHVEEGASVVLFPEMVDNVDYSAMVNTTSCQATLVFRAQDPDNLLMLIYIPDGLRTPGGQGGGVWLYQRIDGTDLPIRAVRSGSMRQAGEPVKLHILTNGPQMQIFLGDEPVIQAVDTAAKAGRLGMLVYSADGRPCEATFADIQR